MKNWRDLAVLSNTDSPLRVVSEIILDNLRHVADVVIYLAVQTNRSVIHLIGYSVFTALIHVELSFMNINVFNNDEVVFPVQHKWWWVSGFFVSSLSFFKVLKTTTNTADISRMITEIMLKISNKSTPSRVTHSSIKPIISAIEARISAQ